MKYPVLLAYAFRPFFLLVGAYAALTIIIWTGYLLAGWPLPTGMPATNWHSHELLFGVVPAAAVGFLLTAVTNWTKSPPLQGSRLLGLVLLWCCGRIFMVFSGALQNLGIPYILPAIIDFAFLPIVGIYFAKVLIKYQNTRNLKLVFVIGLLSAANGLMHCGVLAENYALLIKGQTLAFDTITVMMVIVAGRITAPFSINWLRRQNKPFGGIKQLPWLNNACIFGVFVITGVNFVVPHSQWIMLLFFAVALANALRLLLWRGWIVKAEPLLWILHVAYFWIIIALALRGASYLTDAIAPSLWQHTLGVGAVGTLIFGVMTRVAVGHTGREIKLVPFGISIFILVIAATTLRLIVAVQWLDFFVGIFISAMCWIVASLLFCVLYWPILSTRRVDGKPG